MLNRTSQQFDRELAECRKIFSDKTHDYGTSWRVLRPSSLTDQLFIKAQRIRTIEEKGSMKVNESIDDEYRGLVNYAIIALIQMELGYQNDPELSEESALSYYDQKSNEIKQLMEAKNHDYGEAWRDMRISSYTDLILMKLNRIKQIEDNLGKTRISEGIDSHYKDIVNYSIFALIKLREQDEE